jgi:hypothetical protein
MGWWSATILGGDTPLDIMYDLVHAFYGPSEEWNGWDSDIQVLKQGFEISNELHLVSFIKNADSPAIAAQCIAYAHMVCGARLSPLLRSMAIKACESEDVSTWFNPVERLTYLDEFIKMIQNYDNNTPQRPSEEHLFEVFGKGVKKVPTMEPYSKFGATILGDLTVIQEIDLPRLREEGLNLALATETDDIAVYYSANGYLAISVEKPGVRFENTASCGFGQILLRLKNTSHDVLWPAGVFLHGALFRKTSILLANQDRIISIINGKTPQPDHATFRAATDKLRTEQFIIHAALIECVQHKTILPELGEDDTAFVQGGNL